MYSENIRADFFRRHLKYLLFTYSTPHKAEPRNDVQAFTDCEFLFFGSILGGYGGRFVFNCDGARADTIVIQKYDENLGRFLGKTRYSIREKGVVL